MSERNPFQNEINKLNGQIAISLVSIALKVSAIAFLFGWLSGLAR